MFRPYELPPSPPSRPHAPIAPWKAWLGRSDGESAAPLPLPADWDLLDPDQRVRAIGEW